MNAIFDQLNRFDSRRKKTGESPEQKKKKNYAAVRENATISQCALGGVYREENTCFIRIYGERPKGRKIFPALKSCSSVNTIESARRASSVRALAESRISARSSVCINTYTELGDLNSGNCVYYACIHVWDKHCSSLTSSSY